MADGFVQYGADLPVGTARLTPGQAGAEGDIDLKELLAFANDRSSFSDDPEFDAVIGNFQQMQEREDKLNDYGGAARKWYLQGVPRSEALGYLEGEFDKRTAKALYDTTEEQWKPYRDMYKVAGEYARDERVDPGYVQELDSNDRKLFYAFMMEQASPEQRSALGKFGENWLRGMEDVWDSFEENISKVMGMEIATHSVPLFGQTRMKMPILRMTTDEEKMAIEEAVADAAETRRRIRAAREGGDPVASESMLGQGVLDLARMGPRLAGGTASSIAGGPAGSIAFWTAQIAPSLEDEMVDMGVDREKAVLWSYLAAVPSAAVEAAQLDQVTSGATKAVKRGALGYITALAKRYGTNWAKQVGEEGFQFIIEETGKRAAAAGNKEIPDIDWDDVIARGTEEMKRAGVSLGILTALGHAPGLRGIRAASRLQRLHNDALVVSQKSEDIKLKQYAETIANMIDNQTPIDKKSRGLAERVMKEADAIRLKEALITVAEGRAEERAAEKVEAEEEAKPEPEKPPVAEPEKPVEKPKPKPKPEVKKEKKAAPAPKEANELRFLRFRLVSHGLSPEEATSQINWLLSEPDPKKRAIKLLNLWDPTGQEQPDTPITNAVGRLGGFKMDMPEKAEPASPVAEPEAKVEEARTEPVPPAEPAAEVAPSPIALKKRARARKAKTGKGIRRIALEVDNGLKKGTITQAEAEVLYEDLGRRAVELEQDPKDKRNLTNVKESLRKRLRAIKGMPAQQAAPAAPTSRQLGTLLRQAAERQRLKRLTKYQKDMERQIKQLKAERNKRVRNEDFNVANQIDKQIAVLQREIEDVKQRKKRPGAKVPLKREAPAAKPESVAEPQVPIKEPEAEPQRPAVEAQPPARLEPEFKETPGPRMGEEVLAPKPEARLATEHTRADAMADLELDDKSPSELEEIARERGIDPTGMDMDQMVDAILEDAIAGGEIAPIVEGMQPEVEARAEKIPAHRRPVAPPRLGVASVVALSDNEVRLVRDEIASAMNNLEAAHGVKDAFRKHLQAKGVPSPQSVVRQAAEDGDYGAAARRLQDIRSSLKTLGKRSKKLRTFRDSMRKGLDRAIAEFEAIERGELPSIVENQRQSLADAAKMREAQEAAFEKARRENPAFDRKMAADEATVTQPQDVGFAQEEGVAETQVLSTKNAEAEMRKAKREGEAISEESGEQIVAEHILDMNDANEEARSYAAMTAQYGPEFVQRVKDIVDSKRSQTDRTRSEVNDQGEIQTFDAGFGPTNVTNFLKDVNARWTGLLSKAIRGYKLYKAKSTIFEHLRRAYSSEAYTQEVARKAVMEAFKTADDGSDITKADAELLSFWREDPKNYELPLRLKGVGERINQFYDIIEKMWKQLGMGTWPNSRIKANDARIVGLKEKQGDYKQGSKKWEAFQQEIESVQAENERLKELRYHRHIVLKKPINPEQAVAMDAGIQRGSHKERLKTTPTRALGREYDTIEDLQNAGFDVELDFRVALADAFSYVQNKLMVEEFHEKIIKQDPSMALPAKDAPDGWVELPGIEPYNRRRYKSGSARFKVFGPDGKMRTEVRPLYKFKGEKWKVHPILAEAVRDFTESASQSTSAGKLYDGLNTMMKQLKFYNPLIMTINNLQQGFGLSGMRFAYNWADAFRSILSKDDDYMAMLEGDVFSTPPDLAPENFHDRVRAEINEHLSTKSAFGRFMAKFGVNSVADAWKFIPVHPQSATYKMLRSATWWLDRVARVASVKAQMQASEARAKRMGIPWDGKLRAEAMSRAIVKSREFHGDYNLTRREVSKWMRRIFLTPAYKTAMWYRLFPKIVQDFYKGTEQYVKGEDVTHDVAPLIRIGIGVSAMTTAMAMLGYSWEDKYRFVKKEDDEEGEHVIQMFGPFSEPFKVFGRAMAGFEEGGLTTATERVLYNNLAAVPKAAYSLLWRNRDWKGDRIVTPGAPIKQKQLETTWFLLKETLPFLGQIEAGSKAEQTKFDVLMNLASITMYHRDSSKRTWYKHKLDQRQKELRAWAKEKAEGDPDLSADYNEAAAKRFSDYAIALSTALKQYEERIETAKKGTAWQRFANQFDNWGFTHSKIDPGNPTLLEEKSLTELRALSQGPVRRKPGESEADFIERVMRKVFARTFLERVADHE